MKIYEKELAIAKKLEDRSVKAEAALVSKEQSGKYTSGQKLHNRSEEEAKYMEKMIPEDCMLMDAVLVSTDWNKNDDVFTPDQTFKARYSPTYKPVNVNHKGREAAGDNTTLGVIIGCMCANDDYSYFIPKDYENIGLDEKFHLVVNTLLWEAYFPKAIAEVKQNITDGKQFVSMEAFFDDFGYALRKYGSNQTILLERNELTAHLTAALRIYGGDGWIEHEGTKYQIGRHLKKIMFSGVGLVLTPANEKSIVFEDYISRASTIEFVKSNKDFAESVLNLQQRKIVLWPK